MVLSNEWESFVSIYNFKYLLLILIIFTLFLNEAELINLYTDKRF